MASRRQSGRRPDNPRRGLRSKRTGLLILAAAGSLAGALGIGCSSQPQPPDMPPFPGTEEFLDEQARIQHAASADEAFRERYNLGDPASVQMRSRQYLQNQAMVEERSRQIELAKQQERERRARERAEEGRRRFAELEQARKYREDLRRERAKAEEGKMRFAEIQRENQNREDLRREKERAEEGKRRFGDTQFLDEAQRREAARKQRQDQEEGRRVFNATQARSS